MIEGHEVALVYFGTGQKPKEYPGPQEWEARLMIERSYAIKCPTIGFQLAGSKKIQQLLAQPGVLEKFLTPGDSMKLRRFFAGIHIYIIFRHPSYAYIK